METMEGTVSAEYVDVCHSQEISSDENGRGENDNRLEKQVGIGGTSIQVTTELVFSTRFS